MRKANIIIILLSLSVLIIFFSINKSEFMSKKNINEEKMRVENMKDLASLLIPEEAMLRDLAIIPETDKYLGIYIENYNYIEEHGYWYGNESVSGDYYLFLLENNTIIDVVEIPKYETYPDLGIDIFKVSFLNEDEEIISLIQFDDYTGDTLKHQFIIPGYYLPGGLRGKLIAGYNINENKLEVYPFNLKTKDKAWWLSNYETSNEGELKLLIQDCHYNIHCEIMDLGEGCVEVEDKRIFDHYRFDNNDRVFNYYKTTESECMSIIR